MPIAFRPSHTRVEIIPRGALPVAAPGWYNDGLQSRVVIDPGSAHGMSYGAAMGEFLRLGGRRASPIASRCTARFDWKIGANFTRPACIAPASPRPDPFLDKLRHLADQTIPQ